MGLTIQENVMEGNSSHLSLSFSSEAFEGVGISTDWAFRFGIIMKVAWIHKKRARVRKQFVENNGVSGVKIMKYHF